MTEMVLTGIWTVALIMGSTGLFMAGFDNLRLVAAGSYGDQAMSNAVIVAGAWVVAVIGYFVPPMLPGLALLAVAIPARLSSRAERTIVPELLSGLGLALLGIDFMSGRILPLVGLNQVFGAAQHPALLLVGLAGGVVVAVLVRSSFGATALAVSLALPGVLPLWVVAGMVLGGGLGGAFAQLKAAAGLSLEARRSALTQVAVHGVACLWAGAMLTALAQSGWALGHGLVLQYPALPVLGFLSCVYLLNPVVVLPLRGHIASLVQRIYPEESSGALGSAQGAAQGSMSTQLQLVPGRYPEALAANLLRIQSGLAQMAEPAYEILMIVLNASQVGDEVEQDTERVVQLRSRIKQAEEDVMGGLTRMVQQPCRRDQAEQIQQQQRIAQQLSLIADDCYKTMRLFARSYRKKYRFHEEGREELFDFISQILDFLRYNSDYLQGQIPQPDWELANQMEERIDAGRDLLKARVRKVLKRGDDADVKAELVYIDIVSHLEHVGDRCLNISDSVRRSRGLADINPR